jgi:hypothetical protein
MFKGIWRSSPGKAAVVADELPLLSNPDHEYLFMQLLEGVAHGWQQPRVIKFFQRVKQRAPKSQWVAWLNIFGNQLVQAANPNEELARRMIMLSELDCGEVTNLAGEFGHQLLGRIYGGYEEETLPDLDSDMLSELDITRFDEEDEEEDRTIAPLPITLAETTLRSDYREERRSMMPPPPAPPKVIPPPLDFSAVTMPSTDIRISRESFKDSNVDFNFDANSPPPTQIDIQPFGVVPSELRIAKEPGLLPVETYLEKPPAPEEEKVISIEEFGEMLRQDDDLVKDIAQQMGLNTRDPQVVLNAVITQMQQQIQDGN